MSFKLPTMSKGLTATDADVSTVSLPGQSHLNFATNTLTLVKGALSSGTNNAPILTTLTSGGGPISVGTSNSGSISFAGATDADSDQIKYAIVAGTGSQLTFAKTTGIAVGESVTYTSPATAGTGTFLVQAYDAHGGTSATVTVNVTLISAPTTIGQALVVVFTQVRL
jgi:hypothetical protein